MVNSKNSVIVILGASGDLAQRKLLPALSILYTKKVIDNSNIVVGTGRSEFTDEAFRKRFNICDDFGRILYYHQNITGLKKYLKSKGTFKKVIFFLSLPPSAYGKAAKALSEEGFSENTSIIIEKPFGYDYKSAQALNKDINQYFDESQIFRIDHYLAKEAVQNILVFRFANSIFEPVWNSRYIESIQINSFETLGLEGRAAYFDSSGIMRDMMQNHLMQLLSLITMEPPTSLSADDIRSQKISLLKTLKIDEANRSQYEGYATEEGVKPNSNTDTYSEVKISINNFRWSGTPIYIKAGKQMDRKSTEIGIKFRKLPQLLFNEKNDVNSNEIIFKIQPSESILLDLSSKVPGSENTIRPTTMNFYYNEEFEEEIPEAYQKLLSDALNNDQTLFVSAEETETSWKIFEPFLDQGEVSLYRKGKPPKSGFKENWINFKKYTD